MLCFSSPRYEAMITVVKPSTRILSVMYYAREPGKIKYALFPFKSIIGGKYIFKKVMILNKMKILLICIKYPPTS